MTNRILLRIEEQKVLEDVTPWMNPKNLMIKMGFSGNRELGNILQRLADYGFVQSNDGFYLSLATMNWVTKTVEGEQWLRYRELEIKNNSLYVKIKLFIIKHFKSIIGILMFLFIIRIYVKYNVKIENQFDLIDWAQSNF